MDTDDARRDHHSADGENVARCLDAYFEGLRSNDASIVPFADDVVLENPHTRSEGEPIRGRDNVAEFLETVAADMPRVDLERHVIDGQYACSILEWEASDGIVVPTVDCFEIEDGVITRIRIYFDRALS